MRITKGIVVKLQVTTEDKNYISRLLGAKRVIWNLALAYKSEIWKSYKQRNPCMENKEEKKLVSKLMSNNELQKAFAKKELLKYEGFEFLANCLIPLY